MFVSNIFSSKNVNIRIWNLYLGMMVGRYFKICIWSKDSDFVCGLAYRAVNGTNPPLPALCELGALSLRAFRDAVHESVAIGFCRCGALTWWPPTRKNWAGPRQEPCSYRWHRVGVTISCIIPFYKLRLHASIFWLVIIFNLSCSASRDQIMILNVVLKLNR